MFKIKELISLAAFLLMISFGLIGCGGATTVTNTTKPADNSKPADNTKTADTKPAADKIGVPECDEYVAKYEACIFDKVPEAQRAILKTSFEAQRKGFKDAAATPQGKSGLAATCKQMLETAKSSMNAYGCKW